MSDEIKVNPKYAHRKEYPEWVLYDPSDDELPWFGSLYRNSKWRDWNWRENLSKVANS